MIDHSTKDYFKVRYYLPVCVNYSLNNLWYQWSERNGSKVFRTGFGPYKCSLSSMAFVCKTEKLLYKSGDSKVFQRYFCLAIFSSN